MKTEQGEKVQELSKEVQLKNGLPGTASQIKRTGDAAIYKVDDTNYEVIKIRVLKRSHFNGTYFPEREVYPSSSDWGVYGFTFIQLSDAESKFNELIGEVKPVTIRETNFRKLMDYYFNSNSWL